MNNTLTLYGNGNCGVCKNSVIKLKNHNYRFTFVELNSLSEQQKRTIMMKKGNDTRLPLVFVNGEYVGGPDAVDQIISK
jgi:glutaredoxin